MKFDFQGIDWNFSDVQPVTMISGRYLNEGDILGQKEKCGDRGGECQKTFRNGKRGGKDLPDHRLRGYRHAYTVVGVYKRDERLPEALSGGSGDTGSAYIPYTLLTWPNDLFYYCRLYAKEGTDMVNFHVKADDVSRKIKNRNAEDFYTNTVAK